MILQSVHTGLLEYVMFISMFLKTYDGHTYLLTPFALCPRGNGPSLLMLCVTLLGYVYRSFDSLLKR